VVQARLPAEGGALLPKALEVATGRFPGCSHTRYLDGHHIRHWADGGQTRLSNLVLLCRFHHRQVHEGRVEVRMLDDGALRFTGAARKFQRKRTPPVLPATRNLSRGRLRRTGASPDSSFATRPDRSLAPCTAAAHPCLRRATGAECDREATLKTLLLTRHAKSDPATGGMPDHSRPLNERGRRDASEMGRRLRGKSVRPDHIVSSSATRARETAELLAVGLGFDAVGIRFLPLLYTATADELLDIVSAMDDTLGCVVLVAHNPSLTELAHRLSPAITHLPTCAVAAFHFPVESWGEASFQHPAEFLFERPEKRRDATG
jgi:phosphohistidine phosphatase